MELVPHSAGAVKDAIDSYLALCLKGTLKGLTSHADLEQLVRSHLQHVKLAYGQGVFVPKHHYCNILCPFSQHVATLA